MKEPIRTIDDLAFEFGRNVLLRRWLASVLDLIIVGAVIGGIISASPSLQHTSIAIPIAVLLWFCYYCFMEARWGSTPGKLITDIRVVDAEGNPPGMVKSIVRTLMRLIEANPILVGAIPAAASIFASKRSQRIGDRVAGTYVLGRKDLARLADDGGVDNHAVMEV